MTFDPATIRAGDRFTHDGVRYKAVTDARRTRVPIVDGVPFIVVRATYPDPTCKAGWSLRDVRFNLES